MKSKFGMGFYFILNIVCGLIKLKSYSVYHVWRNRLLSDSFKSPHLSNHTIPCPVNLLAVFTIGDQIEIIGEFYTLCNFLQDVNAETFATAFDVNPWIPCMITDR